MGYTFPTLGPCPRLAAVDRMGPNKPPDLLDNGGLIARLPSG
jgi:hypothetical protein